MRMLPWLVTVIVLAIGVSWRDSVFIACSAMFALHAFELHMDAGRPWPAWRAAMRCGGIGIASLLSGLILWAVVGAAQLGWWTRTSDRLHDVLLILVMAAAICLLVRAETHRISLRPIADVLGPAAAVLTLAASASGWDDAPFLFAVLVAMAITHSGWRRLQGVGAIWHVGDGQ